MIDIKKLLYALIFSVVIAGLSYAADQRIDMRVQQAINASEERSLERQIQFYIIKKNMPGGLSTEDKINKEILERQLKDLKAKD